MAEGLPTRKVVEELERQKGWPRSTVSRYIAAVRERWVVERAVERATEAEETIARLTKLAFDLRRAKEWGHLIRTEVLLADVRGVRAPEKHDHRVAAIAVTARAPSEIEEPDFDKVLEGLSEEQTRQLRAIAETVVVSRAGAPDAARALPGPSDDA